MVSRKFIVLACLAIVASLLTVSHRAAAQADGQVEVCKPGITDDRLMPLPAALVARARDLFHVTMPDELIRKSTVYRCMNGMIMLCMTGANLACGKADSNRRPAGAIAWCRDHRDADTVPMFVTGHNTIYSWRCSAGAPVIEGDAEAVDARGFLSRNWTNASK